MSFTIEVNNTAVLAAFNRLLQAGENMSPLLRSLGVDIAERAKQRFETLSAPDGTPWEENSPVTIEAFVRANGGYSARTGKLLKKGRKLQASKRPLHGESGDLARQIAPQVSGNTLTVTATPVYAAMQQFGGTRAQFPHLWGDIPARPFLPITSQGLLDPGEERDILAVINERLREVVSG